MARKERERSPERHRSSHRDRDRDSSPYLRERTSQRNGSPSVREKNSHHAKSPPKREKSRSPSPQTKRLRRAQVEREVEKKDDGGERERNNRSRDDRVMQRSEREHERNHNHSKKDDKGAHRKREAEELLEAEYERGHHRKDDDRYSRRDRGSDREIGSVGKERSLGRDGNDGKPSRVKQGRSVSPVDRHRRSKHRSRSPDDARDYREHSELGNSRGAEQRNDDDDPLAQMKAAEEALETKQKQQPSFELSGKLAAETNRFKGVTLLFNEPPEARKPDIRWRLYVFKGGEVLNEPLYIHRQSCYLFGRERRVADIPTDHPSCSKQHAVLQYRQVEKEQPDGTLTKQVRPYLMDLGSTNKTFINDNPIEPQRYYELVEKDTIKFGNSSREYVLLHENSVA